MNIVHPFRTHEKKSFKVLFEQDEETFEVEADVGGFFNDGKYCWVAAGPIFEVYETCKGRKTIARNLSFFVGENSQLTITCVEDVGERWVVIGCANKEKGHLFLYNTARGKIISQAVVPKRVTSLAHVPSNCTFLLPIMAQSEDDVVSMFVGTEGGQICLMQMPKYDINAVGDATVTYMSKNDLSVSNISQKHRKSVSFIDKGPSKCVPLNDQSFKGETFQFLRPKVKNDGDVELEVAGALPCREVKVTSIKVVPQIGSVIVAFSFGGFQFYSLSGLELESCSSGFRHDGLPISFIGFQEPENDPKNYCFLWAVFSDPADPFQTVANMYQLWHSRKEVSDGGFPIYSDLKGISLKLSIDMGDFVQKSSGSNRAFSVCRPVSCFSLNHCQSLLENDEQSFDPENTGSLGQPTLSLFAFVLETQEDSDNLGAKCQRHLVLFDINAYYQAQMPLKPVARHDSLVSYLGIFAYSEGPSVYDVFIDEKRVIKYQHFTPTEQHFYPSSLAFDSVVLEKEGLINFEHLGAQRQLINVLNCSTCDVVLDPVDLCKMAEIYGLLPPDQPSILLEDLPGIVYKECMLNILLEYGCQNPLNDLVKYLADIDNETEFDVFKLMYWIWNKVSAYKNANDILSIPLFNLSCEMAETSTVDSLHKNDGHLRLLKNLLLVMESRAVGKVEDHLLKALRERIRAAQLIIDYFEALLWFVHAGLLPETEYHEPSEQEKEENYNIPLLPYPVSKIKNFYNIRRNILCSRISTLDPNKVLLVDNLVELLGEQVNILWQQEDQNLYPPPSLGSLLQIYLLDGPVLLKHQVVQYILLDIASALRGERNSSVLEALETFPLAFDVSGELTKITHGYWMIDHKKYENGLSCLLSSSVHFNDIGIRNYRSIINLLAYDNEHKRALKFSTLRPCVEGDLEDTFMRLRLLLVNGFICQAFDYVRSERSSGNEECLLTYIFSACAEKGCLDLVMKRPFSKAEEAVFIKFLQSCQNSKAIDLLLAFYLQRGRFSDALSLQKQLKEQKLSNPLRDGIVNAYFKVLPPLTASLTKNWAAAKNRTHVQKSYPKPLSAIVKPAVQNISTNSSRYLAEMVEGTRVALASTPSRERKRKICDSEIPFIKSIRLNDTVEPSLVASAKKVPVKEEVMQPTPKKLKVSQDKSIMGDTSPFSPAVKSVLRTPTVHRIRSQKRSSVLNNPPLSILKARSDQDDTNVIRSKHLRFSTLPPVILKSPDIVEKSLTASPMEMTSVPPINIFEIDRSIATPVRMIPPTDEVRQAVEETREWNLRQNEKAGNDSTYDESTKAFSTEQISQQVSETESFHSMEVSSDSTARLDSSTAIRSNIQENITSNKEETSFILKLRQEREELEKRQGNIAAYFSRSHSDRKAQEAIETNESDKFLKEIDTSGFDEAIEEFNRRESTAREQDMEETNVQLPSTVPKISLDLAWKFGLRWPGFINNESNQEEMSGAKLATGERTEFNQSMEVTELGLKVPDTIDTSYTSFAPVQMEEVTQFGIKSPYAVDDGFTSIEPVNMEETTQFNTRTPDDVRSSLPSVVQLQTDEHVHLGPKISHNIGDNVTSFAPVQMEETNFNFQFHPATPVMPEGKCEDKQMKDISFTFLEAGDPFKPTEETAAPAKPSKPLFYPVGGHSRSDASTEVNDVAFASLQSKPRRLTTFDNTEMEETSVDFKFNPADSFLSEEHNKDVSLPINVSFTFEEANVSNTMPASSDFTSVMFSKIATLGRPSLREASTMLGTDSSVKTSTESDRQLPTDCLTAQPKLDETNISAMEEATAYPGLIENIFPLSSQHTEKEADIEDKETENTFQETTTQVSEIQTKRLTMYHTQTMEETAISGDNFIRESTPELADVLSENELQLPPNNDELVEPVIRSQIKVSEIEKGREKEFNFSNSVEISKYSVELSSQGSLDETVIDVTRMRGVDLLDEPIELIEVVPVSVEQVSPPVPSPVESDNFELAVSDNEDLNLNEETNVILSKPEALATIKFTPEADKKEKNVENFLPAVEVAELLDIPMEISKSALSNAKTLASVEDESSLPSEALPEEQVRKQYDSVDKHEESSLQDMQFEEETDQFVTPNPPVVMAEAIAKPVDENAKHDSTLLGVPFLETSITKGNIVEVDADVSVPDIELKEAIMTSKQDVHKTEELHMTLEEAGATEEVNFLTLEKRSEKEVTIVVDQEPCEIEETSGDVEMLVTTLGKSPVLGTQPLRETGYILSENSMKMEEIVPSADDHVETEMSRNITSTMGTQKRVDTVSRQDSYIVEDVAEVTDKEDTVNKTEVCTISDADLTKLTAAATVEESTPIDKDVTCSFDGQPRKVVKETFDGQDSFIDEKVKLNAEKSNASTFQDLSTEISGETSKDVLFASSTDSEKYITPLKPRRLTKYKRLSEIDISNIISPLVIPSYPPTPKPRKATSFVPPPNFDSSSESSEDEGGPLEDEQEPQQEIKEAASLTSDIAPMQNENDTIFLSESDGTPTSKGEKLSSIINEVMDVADIIDSVSTEKVRCTIVDIDPTTSEQKSVGTQSEMILPNNTEEMGTISEGRTEQRDEVTESIKQISAAQSQTEELPHLEPKSMEVDSLENVSVQFDIGIYKEAKIPGGSPLLKTPPESSASVSSVEETTECLALSKEAMKIPEKLEKSPDDIESRQSEIEVNFASEPPPSTEEPVNEGERSISVVEVKETVEDSEAQSVLKETEMLNVTAAINSPLSEKFVRSTPSAANEVGTVETTDASTAHSSEKEEFADKLVIQTPKMKVDRPRKSKIASKRVSKADITEKTFTRQTRSRSEEKDRRSKERSVSLAISTKLGRIISPLVNPSYPPTPKPRKATSFVPPPNFDSSSESSEDEGGPLEDEQEIKEAASLTSDIAPMQNENDTIFLSESDGTPTSKCEELSSIINEVMDVADSIDSVSTEKVRCTIVDIDPTTSEQKSVGTQSEMILPNNTEEMGAISERRTEQRDEATEIIKQISAAQSQTEELPHLEPKSMEVDSLENVSVQFDKGIYKEAKIPGGAPLLKTPPESSASVSSVEETTESLALSKEAMKIPEKLEKLPDDRESRQSKTEVNFASEPPLATEEPVNEGERSISAVEVKETVEDSEAQNVLKETETLNVTAAINSPLSEIFVRSTPSAANEVGTVETTDASTAHSSEKEEFADKLVIQTPKMKVDRPRKSKIASKRVSKADITEKTFTRQTRSRSEEKDRRSKERSVSPAISTKSGHETAEITTTSSDELASKPVSEKMAIQKHRSKKTIKKVKEGLEATENNKSPLKGSPDTTGTSPLTAVAKGKNQRKLLSEEADENFGLTPGKTSPAKAEKAKRKRTRQSLQSEQSPDLFATHIERSQSTEPSPKRRGRRASSVEATLAPIRSSSRLSGTKSVDVIATPMKSSSRLSGRRSVDFTGTPRRSSSRLSEKISTEEEGTPKKRRSLRISLNSPAKEELSDVQRVEEPQDVPKATKRIRKKSGEKALDKEKAEKLEDFISDSNPEIESASQKKQTRRRRVSRSAVVLPPILESTSEDLQPELQKTRVLRSKNSSSSDDLNQRSTSKRTKRSLTMKEKLQAIREDTTDSEDEVPTPARKRPGPLLKRVLRRGRK